MSESKVDVLERYVFEALASTEHRADELNTIADDVMKQLTDLKMSETLMVAAMMLDRIIVVLHKAVADSGDPEVESVTFGEVTEATMSVICEVVSAGDEEEVFESGEGPEDDGIRH